MSFPSVELWSGTSFWGCCDCDITSCLTSPIGNIKTSALRLRFASQGASRLGRLSFTWKNTQTRINRTTGITASQKVMLTSRSAAASSTPAAARYITKPDPQVKFSTPSTHLTAPTADIRAKPSSRVLHPLRPFVGGCSGRGTCNFTSSQIKTIQ